VLSYALFISEGRSGEEYSSTLFCCCNDHQIGGEGRGHTKETLLVHMCLAICIYTLIIQKIRKLENLECLIPAFRATSRSCTCRRVWSRLYAFAFFRPHVITFFVGIEDWTLLSHSSLDIVAL
jgi:hypothetical protein